MKLINDVIECGYFNKGNYPRIYCTHPKRKVCTVCNTSTKEFPIECPLKEGIPIPKTINEVVDIVKKEGLLFEVFKRTKKLQNITLMEK